MGIAESYINTVIRISNIDFHKKGGRRSWDTSSAFFRQFPNPTKKAASLDHWEGSFFHATALFIIQLHALQQVGEWVIDRCIFFLLLL